MKRCFRFLYVQHEALLPVSVCAAQSTSYEQGTNDWMFVTGFFHV